MRRTQPPATPDLIASSFVDVAADLIAGMVEEDPRRTMRLVLAMTMPCDWVCWSVSSEGVARRVAMRERGMPASTKESKLFATGRSLCSSIVGRLELSERSWLLARLDRRDACVDDFVPFVRLTLDLLGSSWGLRCEGVLTATATCTLGSLGGVLRIPSKQRTAQREAA